MRFPDADVAVVGLGPAGRALVHRLLQHGARVVAVDGAPQRRWWQTYAGWEHQLPDWLEPDVVAARCGTPAIRAPRQVVLHDQYVVLDNERLQARLDITGAQRVTETLADEDLAALAPVVVDARGSHPLDPAGQGRRLGGVARQTAHGVILPAEATRSMLGDAPSVLMDWQPPDGSASWGSRPASFCYVIPLPDGRVLAEETCLASTPGMSHVVLRNRLAARLGRHGVTAHLVATAPTERVTIPMVPAPRRAGTGHVRRFGAAGLELNPVSGYSVFASLAHADEFARQLLDAAGPPRLRSPDPRRAALAALDRLDGDQTMELFNAFAHLPTAAQRAILDPHAARGPLLAAMARQWWLMAPRRRPALVGATATGTAGLLLRARHSLPGWSR